MEYKFAENDNYEDYASGRVLYGVSGVPNFPVRLGNEIYQRCRSYCSKKNGLMVYDPCCGGGYLLTVLGFLNSEIDVLVGSDIDKKMLEVAKKNLSLLSPEGLLRRKTEIKGLYEQYRKTSHKEALESIEHFMNMNRTCQERVFEADCTSITLQKLTGFTKENRPDIIITDVPYGNLVNWNDTKCDGQIIDMMLKSLECISGPDTVLAVISDKNQKISYQSWSRIEKQQIGKRKFEILHLNKG